MKKTLSAAAIALLALTSCGGTEAAPEPELSPSVESAEETPETTTELQSSDDGYTIQARFYWVPHEADTQPTRARFHMRAPTDENSYVTEGLDYDVLPSIETGDYYQHTFFLEDGDSMSATGSVSNPPVDGYIACLLVEAEQNIILDYQESESSDDQVHCYGYAPDVEHDYTPGTPPADFDITE